MITKDKLFLFGFILIFYLSCSSDNEGFNGIETTDNFYIEKYNGFYAQYNVPLSLSNPTYDNLVKFEYDENNRIIKRIGDIIYTGIGGYLHDSLYTQLVYTNNEVHMEKKIAPFGGLLYVEGNEATITFDDNNRMIQKITFHENNNPQIDTTHFYYDNSGKLISYLKTSNRDTNLDWDTRYYEESNLYYSNNNLDSIVTIISMKWSDQPYTILKNKQTQYFEEYDNAINPFRKLQIFEETFNRSLSDNNFTKYRVTSQAYHYLNNDYSQTPTMYEAYEIFSQNWSFVYDENAEWIYNEL
ncbi:hypothetical protein [Neptunitalea lumnitzerae]|uniref:YD repeat-containing protein n=1 Tax=Neptunitalea lumnitzerae TaxID=2965509 RepID=A0ABQ5MJ26_9FLAO|nr:hypothetical protein [Neptunitalea sp. Y10]GLB49404.1 hypothetical protein Y10_17720 [Neptunitalea sp. Y10]